MAPSPVTISYEFEYPRFAYAITVDGDEETVEANYCVRRDGRFVCVELTDIVSAGTGVALARTDVFDSDWAAVDGFEADRLGTTVLQAQFIRRPSVLERLAPWRWPPRVEDCPFAVPERGTRLHPEGDDRGTFAGEVIHSLTEAPVDGYTD